MLADQQLLHACFEIGKLGLNFPLVTGIRIGRGFADVGYEEYSVIDTRRAVSMLTGTIIALDDFYLNYYFLVPTVDEVTKEIFQRGWDITAIEYRDQRDWVVTAQQVDPSHPKGIAISSKPRPELHSAMIHLLKKILTYV